MSAVIFVVASSIALYDLYLLLIHSSCFTNIHPFVLLSPLLVDVAVLDVLCREQRHRTRDRVGIIIRIISSIRIRMTRIVSGVRSHIRSRSMIIGLSLSISVRLSVIRSRNRSRRRSRNRIRSRIRSRIRRSRFILRKCNSISIRTSLRRPSSLSHIIHNSTVATLNVRSMIANRIRCMIMLISNANIIVRGIARIRSRNHKCIRNRLFISRSDAGVSRNHAFTIIL